MPDTEASKIVEFDADATIDAARAATEGTLYTLIEFDIESFNVLYVDETTRAMYPSEEEMLAHFGRIHDFVNLDFTEIALFTEDLLPFADRVRYKATAMDAAKFVRLYVSDSEGLFITLDPNEPVEPVVNAIEATLEE